MKPISSRDNPQYKELKLLASSPQARRKSGRTLLDGVHLCEAYLQRDLPLLCVVSEASVQQQEVATILQRCEREAGTANCILLPENLYHALSQVEHGVGLMFVIDMPIGKAPPRLTGPALLLDRLQDPGNLGSILRSAAAAGIADIFCSPGTVHAWSPKVLRAGMGAHFLLNIVEQVELTPLVTQATLPVLATSSHASRCLYDVDLGRPVAWLFGHEGQGVAPELLAQATEQVTIPHAGPVESLNVAASVAICLFEQLRQRQFA